MSDSNSCSAFAARRPLRRSRHARSMADARRSALVLLVLLCTISSRLLAATNPKIPLSVPSTSRARASSPPVKVQDTNYTFPVTPVGETSGTCNALCFCSDVSNCTCDRSGTETLVHDLAQPFSAYNYRIQPYGNGVDCYAGSPAQLPVFVDVGQQLTFNIDFSPTNQGTFTDYLTLSGFTYYLSGSTPSGSPNLVPYQPSGWSDALVISTTPGTQQDSGTITSSDTLYASWAVLNNGNEPTSLIFYSDLYLDGVFLQRWHTDPPLNAGSYAFIKDYAFGSLAPGTHTLELVPDETATVGPSDNYTKTFTVVETGAPVLVPYQPSGWSGPLVVSTTPGTQAESPTITSSDTLYASWAVANVGSVPTSVLFYTELVLDGAVLQTWFDNPPVNPGTYVALKDYQFGPLSVGSHSLQLVPDATQTVGTSNTYNVTLNVTPASCNQAGSRGQSASCGPALRLVATSLNIMSTNPAPTRIQRIALHNSSTPLSFAIGEGFMLKVFALNPDGSEGPAVSATYSLSAQSPAQPPASSSLSTPPVVLFGDTVLLSFSSAPKDFFPVHSGTATLTVTTASATLSLQIQVAAAGYHLGSSNYTDKQGNDVDALVLGFADLHGMPPQVVKAVIDQEASRNFDELAYRYEPLGFDYRYFSHGQNLRNDPRYMGYTVATIPDSLNGALVPGKDLTPTDIALRQQYYVTTDSHHHPLPALASIPPANSPARPIEYSDGPIPMENILFTGTSNRHYGKYNWLSKASPALVQSFDAFLRTKEPFTAQTVLAASYGLMQVAPVTGIDYGFTSGGVLRQPTDLLEGETSVDAGTNILAAKAMSLPLGEAFSTPGEMRLLWADALSFYNGASTTGTLPTTYGTMVMTTSDKYFPRQ
jgi:hypothetical protein